MIEKLITILIITAPLIYFWVFWLNPFTIKKILKKKGYSIDYVKSFLKEKYSLFYEWIPKILLK